MRLAKFSLTLIPLLLMLLALLNTAMSRSGQKPDLGAIDDATLNDVKITFERTGCYGDCPSYVLTVSGDGTVTYVGTNNVKLKGAQQSKVKSEVVKKLVAEFARADFLSISNDYTTRQCHCTFCTDMPSAITTIEVKGTKHTVDHYYGCRCAPKALFDLETAIDKTLNVEQWTGDVSKSGPFGTTCASR